MQRQPLCNDHLCCSDVTTRTNAHPLSKGRVGRMSLERELVFFIMWFFSSLYVLLGFGFRKIHFTVSLKGFLLFVWGINETLPSHKTKQHMHWELSIKTRKVKSCLQSGSMERFGDCFSPCHEKKAKKKNKLDT